MPNKIGKELQNCKDIKTIHELMTERNWVGQLRKRCGGREFLISGDNSGGVTLKAIVNKLKKLKPNLRIETLEKKQFFEVVKKVDELNRFYSTNKLIKREKNKCIRLSTKIRRFFGNLFSKRDQFLSKFLAEATSQLSSKSDSKNSKPVSKTEGDQPVSSTPTPLTPSDTDNSKPVSKTEGDQPLSSTSTPLTPSEASKVDFSKIDIQQLNSFIVKDRPHFSNGSCDPSRPIKYYAGRHMLVFEYEYLPGVIIKLLSHGKAQEMMDCLQYCQKLNEAKLITNHIPQAQMFKLEGHQKDEYTPDDGYAVVLMEKLEGCTNPSECMELSEREYEQFAEKPDLLNKWKAYFSNAAEFICAAGYWDVDWRNIILMKDGLGFIDFEGVNGKDLMGLTRLLMIAPVECFDDILNIGRKYKMDEKTMLCYVHKQRRKADLDLRSRVRAWHNQMKIVDRQRIDPKDLPKNSIEYGIIKSINDNLEKGYNSYQGSLIFERYLHCQPLHKIKKEDYDKALKNLQDRNIICTWEITPNTFQPELDSYEIYC